MTYFIILNSWLIWIWKKDNNWRKETRLVYGYIKVIDSITRLQFLILYLYNIISNYNYFYHCNTVGY
jgi:hypothetical protein